MNFSQLTKELLELGRQYGCGIEQIKGQRRFGPKENVPEPPRGTEVFISGIPRDCFENELIPVFSRTVPTPFHLFNLHDTTKLYDVAKLMSVWEIHFISGTLFAQEKKMGDIYQFRMMMDFSGTNRGYAFASYNDRETAFKAVRELNGVEIRPGNYLRVTISLDNRRLYIGNLPRYVKASQLKELLLQKTEGIQKLSLCKDELKPKMNKGYAFVEYKSHTMACIARRHLVGKLTIKEHNLVVDWAEPEKINGPENKTTAPPAINETSTESAHTNGHICYTDFGANAYMTLSNLCWRHCWPQPQYVDVTCGMYYMSSVTVDVANPVTVPRRVVAQNRLLLSDLAESRNRAAQSALAYIRWLSIEHPPYVHGITAPEVCAGRLRTQGQ